MTGVKRPTGGFRQCHETGYDEEHYCRRENVVSGLALGWSGAYMSVADGRESSAGNRSGHGRRHNHGTCESPDGPKRDHGISSPRVLRRREEIFAVRAGRIVVQGVVQMGAPPVESP